VSRGGVHSTGDVEVPGGDALVVPVCVAWVQCACGAHLTWISDTEDNAVAGLASVEAEDGWDGDVCDVCAAQVLVGRVP